MKLTILSLALFGANAEEQGLIKNKHGICMDASQRGVNGGKVHMWGCSSQNKNQVFTYDNNKKQLKNKFGFCLRSGGQGKGANVNMWRCDDDDHDQRFYMGAGGTIIGNNRDGNNQNLCLDANQRNKYGGTISMWTCNSKNHNQQWDFDRESHVAIDDPDTGLVKQLYGKCLDASQRNTNGGKVHMWDCSDGNKNQNFVYDSNTHMMKNKHADKNGDFFCLRNSDKIVGGRVEMWKCDTEDVFQQWWHDPWNNLLKASHGGQKVDLCLDAAQRGNTNGGKVNVWKCDANNRNQQWNVDSEVGVVTDEPDTGLVKSIQGLCMDASQRSTFGGVVHMWGCDESNKNQEWTYDVQTRQVKNANSDFCLRNQDVKNGGKVSMWKCQTDDFAQRWYYNQWSGLLTSGKKGDGKMMCLDANARTTRGGKISVWECNENNANQRWHMDTTGHIGVDNENSGLFKNLYGKCVDASQRNTEDGNVHMWDCSSNNKNQIWEYSEITKQVKNKYGKCLQHKGKKNGSDLRMSSCDVNENDQKFWYDSWNMRVSAGYANGKQFCIDGNKRDANGGNLGLWECNNDNKNQNFNFDSQELDAIDCVGAWGEYGTCALGTETCGPQTKTRTYAVSTFANFGGKSCANMNADTESSTDCAPIECPEIVDLELAIDETIESFTQDKQDTLIQKIAKQLGVDTSSVSITVGQKANPISSRRLSEALLITVTISVLPSQVTDQIEKIESPSFAAATGCTFVAFKPTAGSSMCATCKWIPNAANGKGKIEVVHYINSQSHGEKGLQHKCYHLDGVCKCLCQDDTFISGGVVSHHGHDDHAGRRLFA